MDLKGLKSRCQQGWFPLEAREGNLFLASPSFWWLPAFLGLWLHHSNLCSVVTVSSHL